MATTMKLVELILDPNLYPRCEVDPVQVTRLVEAIETGEQLPPIIVDKQSKRIVDGFHRYRAAKRAKREEIEVELRDFPSEEEILLAAIRLNSRHGVPLGPQDRARVIYLTRDMDITDGTVASALAISPVRIIKIRAQMGRVGRRQMHLKVALRERFAGAAVPQAVADINPKLGGNTAEFYVHQLLMLLGADALPRTEQMPKLLRELHSQLGRYLKGKPPA